MKAGRKKIIVAGAVLLLLAGALFLRINFIENFDQAPVVWDAAGYNIQAREFQKAFQAWPDQARFMTHFSKAYEMALPKCEVYPLFLGGVYLAFGADFQTARLVQAVVGTLSCLLIFLIAIRVFGPKTALISLAAAAAYIPFIISEGRLLNETAAIFIFLITNLVLIRTLEKGGWWRILIAGLITAVLVITRTFFQYIYFLYWPMLVIGLARKKVRWFFPKSLLFIVGMAVIIVPRLFWTPQVDRHQRAWISGSWRNGLAMYCGIYPPNRGVQSTADPGGEILRSIKIERGPGWVDDRYFAAAQRILVEKPLEALPVLIAKGWLFYQRTYNDFLQSYILGPSGIDWLNRVIMITGLFGLGLVFGSGVRSWPLLVSAIYGGGLCFLADAESRYLLVIIPFLIIFGAQLAVRICSLCHRLGGEGEKRHRRKLMISAPVSIAAGIGLLVAPERVLAFLPALTFLAAFRIVLIWRLLFLLSLIPLCLTIYRPLAPSWRRYTAAILPPVFLILVYLSAVKVHPAWREWKTRLDRDNPVITQKIILPDDLRRYRSAELKLDLVSGPSFRYDLSILVDGEPVRRFQGGLTPDPASWVPKDKRRAFPIYLRETNRRMPRIRQWYTVPLDIRKLEGKSSMTVEVRFYSRAPFEENYVEIYGDYPIFESPELFLGPTFSKSPSRLSLYKYLFDDDWRIWEETDLAAFPAPIPEKEEEDLSPLPGLQRGTYRIFLLLSGKQPPASDFPVAVRREKFLTRKTTPAGYFNLQLWSVNPWKRRSDRMLIEAAHAAPGDRGGFSLVAYADTDNDGAPDREIARSPYHTAEKAGQWSSFTFTAAEENIFVGMSWAPNPDKVVYYERILWPDEVFPEVMYYQTGPGAATANPVLTNLRITFLEDEPSQSASPR